MVAADETTAVPGQIESSGTFGKLRQTLSSSLLTAQDKGVTEAPVEPAPTPPPAQPPPSAKTEREAGKAPSRAGACRVCLKALKPGEVFHICNGCQHRVCEDCSSYSKPASDEDANSWRCSVCRRKAGPRIPPAAQDSTDSLLDVPVLEALQRRHSEARLGSGSSNTALAPPRSPELRRHSDVSPASLKELEKLKGGGSSTPMVESRRPSAVTPARRRSIRAPTPRQHSCDDDKQAGPGSHQQMMPAPPSISRRASAVDMTVSSGSRRGSYRTDDASHSDSSPQISGLGVDEERPLRRRGSQLAMAALTSRSSDSDAASSAALAAAAAARQMSVDAEAIKIVIHDVDDRTPRQVTLRRDPNDKGHRSRGFGMRVVGGKPDASGRREAVIVWTVPGGPADLAGLQQGDKVLEWCGVSLTERSFEEVCAVLERGGDTVELLVEPAHQMEEPPTPVALPPHHHALYEPETDKSPSSPTRRKLPKTPV
ncbi:unnamed protein product [Leptidea sinapis]|uniref:PDZ domain-containing protein n=1 Tax=Leptidea sinapis TaxID=189913 RepID=A0A5E4Q1E6_9NEOP|nr:unnamed protein product [Leptidea sinapis]